MCVSAPSNGTAFRLRLLNASWDQTVLSALVSCVGVGRERASRLCAEAVVNGADRVVDIDLDDIDALAQAYERQVDENKAAVAADSEGA